MNIPNRTFNIELVTDNLIWALSVVGCLKNLDSKFNTCRLRIITSNPYVQMLQQGFSPSVGNNPVVITDPAEEDWVKYDQIHQLKTRMELEEIVQVIYEKDDFVKPVSFPDIAEVILSLEFKINFECKLWFPEIKHENLGINCILRNEDDIDYCKFFYQGLYGRDLLKKESYESIKIKPYFLESAKYPEEVIAAFQECASSKSLIICNGLNEEMFLAKAITWQGLSKIKSSPNTVALKKENEGNDSKSIRTVAYWPNLFLLNDGLHPEVFSYIGRQQRLRMDCNFNPHNLVKVLEEYKKEGYGV